MATLPDGAVPRTDYVYHLPHCVFNQLYADNATVRAAFDAMPLVDMCQHGNNAGDNCDGAYDATPDPLKLTYKGEASMGISDAAYDAWVVNVSEVLDTTRLAKELVGGATTSRPVHLPCKVM